MTFKNKYIYHADRNQDRDGLWGLVGREDEKIFWADGEALYAENC